VFKQFKIRNSDTNNAMYHSPKLNQKPKEKDKPKSTERSKIERNFGSVSKQTKYPYRGSPADISSYWESVERTKKEAKKSKESIPEK
jgi:hypothetical protein